MGKHEDADLILKLYDLRRETVMRDARNWLFTFNPTSIEDVMSTLMGEHSGHFRMVCTYWDMACALVNNGAIDEELFNQTNGEQIFVYMKVQPVLNEIQTLVSEEHRLYGKGTLSDTDRERLATINVELDQCRDLLRQRRALRETGGDPNAAQVRPPDVVEKYEQ